MVVRTRLNVTLYVHCMSCFVMKGNDHKVPGVFRLEEFKFMPAEWFDSRQG